MIKLVKSMIYMTFIIVSLGVSAQEFSLDDMAGPLYKLSPKGPINFLGTGRSFYFIMAIDTKKDEFGHNIIGINEHITQVVGLNPPVEISTLQCFGTAEMAPEHILEADITCPNQQFYDMRIEFSKIQNKRGNTFEVPVYISNYHQELIMVMEKQEIKINLD